MKKNIMDLAEEAEIQIECEYCGNSFVGYGDVFDFAESADEEGWIVNRSGKVKCPECVNKSKKKK